MSNMTVLQQNTLAGLSETAGMLYLALVDKYQGHRAGPGERRAFMEAAKYDERTGNVIDYILTNCPLDHWADTPRPLPQRARTELSSFFAERWRHNFIGHGA